MHSRIFELSKQKIKEEDYLDTDVIIFNHEWFVGMIADYVDNIDDRAKDIEWLKETLVAFGFEETSEPEVLLFNEDFSGNYFKQRFELFKQKAENLTLEDFQNGFMIYKAQILLEEKLGFYIYYEDQLMTLDAFVRDCLEPGAFYYIGGIVDYHC